MSVSYELQVATIYYATSCVKTTRCSTLTVFAHIVAMVCVIFIGNFNIYDRRTNNHLRNALRLLHPDHSMTSVPHSGDNHGLPQQ